MTWAIVAYLYVSGCLLAICYDDAVGGRARSVGSVLLITTWPIVVPCLWIGAISKEIWERVRK